LISLHRSPPLPPPPPFPTRRSSDLTGGHRDRLVGRAVEPTERAIGMMHANIREAEAREPLGGADREVLDPLDRHDLAHQRAEDRDRKSTRLNSSHVSISYAVFCLKK